jgi:hypothetical protein
MVTIHNLWYGFINVTNGSMFLGQNGIMNVSLKSTNSTKVLFSNLWSRMDCDPPKENLPKCGCMSKNQIDFFGNLLNSFDILETMV